MNVQIVMDHKGDSRFYFAPASEVDANIAKRRFDHLLAEGYTAAERTALGTAQVTRKFNPQATETLFIPRLMGG